MNKEGLKIFCGTLIILLFSFNLAFSEDKDIKMSKVEWKKLNTFFSNFSEVFLKPFEKDQISNKELIKFGIYHNYINNDKLFNKYDSSHLKINKKYVEDAIVKYFGRKLILHESIEGVIYKDGYYIVQIGAGEVYAFTQVTKFVDVGNGYYLAYLNLYHAGSGFTGDPNGNLESWKEEDDFPKLGGKMKATVQKITINGNSRYVLIDYLEDK